jgi:hypothetical protein
VTRKLPWPWTLYYDAKINAWFLHYLLIFPCVTCISSSYEAGRHGHPHREELVERALEFIKTCPDLAEKRRERDEARQRHIAMKKKVIR